MKKWTEYLPEDVYMRLCNCRSSRHDLQTLVNCKWRAMKEAGKDKDVFDDVCDALSIAFCGPAELTEAGKEHFAKALALDFTFIGDVALIHVDDPDEKTWKRNLKQAKELFCGLAGYCSEADYNKWFKEV